MENKSKVEGTVIILNLTGIQLPTTKQKEVKPLYGTNVLIEDRHGVIENLRTVKGTIQFNEVINGISTPYSYPATNTVLIVDSSNMGILKTINTLGVLDTLIPNTFKVTLNNTPVLVVRGFSRINVSALTELLVGEPLVSTDIRLNHLLTSTQYSKVVDYDDVEFQRQYRAIIDTVKTTEKKDTKYYTSLATDR